jgi:thiol:disulfide interchange protein DsbD
MPHFFSKRARTRAVSFVAACGLLLSSAPVRSEPPPAPHTRASLLSEVGAVQAGRPFWVGVLLQMDPGWHTYWKNPGDSGLASRIRWELPSGFTAGPIEWPWPERFSGGPLVSYGYEREVLLLSRITPPATLPPGGVRLAGVVQWLECQEICVPGRSQLGLHLPLAAASAPSPAADARFTAARRRLPASASGWRVDTRSGKGTLSLLLRPPRDVRLGPETYFFSAVPRLIQYAAPQRLTQVGPRQYQLELTLDPNAVSPSPRTGGGTPAISGVLVSSSRTGAAAWGIDTGVPVASP